MENDLFQQLTTAFTGLRPADARKTENPSAATPVQRFVMLFLVQERLYLCVRPIRCRCRTVHASQDPDLQNQLQFISETQQAVLRTSVCQIMPSFSTRTPVCHGGLKSFRERCDFLVHNTTCHGMDTSQAGARRSLLSSLLTSRHCSRWNSDNSIRSPDLGSTSPKPEDDSSHLQHRCIEQHRTATTLFDRWMMRFSQA
jgi:hypothetical protein